MRTALPSVLTDHQEVGMIDMAVIRVPRISNFTDFNPLESIPGVSLRYVQHPSELGNPDVIISVREPKTRWMISNGCAKVEWRR